MSLFLGKIHYWLFNKILWFEGLEDEIIKLAEKNGIEVETIRAEANLKHGEKTQNKNLEEIIDTNNIHGWLQSKIHSAEGRMAFWINSLMKSDKVEFTELEEIFTSQGIKAGNEVKSSKEILNAKDIYNSINDYLLDGMPCDRVNEVLVMDEDTVEWKRRICVHKEIWEKEGVDVETFYNLRSLWIKAFVNVVNSNFEYSENNKYEYSIKIKM